MMLVKTRPNDKWIGNDGKPFAIAVQIRNASGFNYQTAGGNSSFNAGQVRMTRRFARGMSGTARYTFAKAIDNASSFNGTGA